MVAAAVIGAGALSAGASMLGSSQAAGSAKNAAQIQQNQYYTTRGDLLPYNAAGQDALSKAQALTDLGPTGGGPNYLDIAYNQYMPGQMTQAQLEATPGYQFTLDQGLKATQSAAAARGLGISGASLKGASDYATGLADKTYLDQFNVQQQRFQDVLNLNTGQQGNLQNQFNRLYQIGSLGESAAAQTGQAGTTAAANAGNYLNQAGLASAAGTTGVANAATGAVNSYLGYNALQSYLNPQTGGYQQSQNALQQSQNALNAGGSPAAFQAAYGLASNQFVP